MWASTLSEALLWAFVVHYAETFIVPASTGKYTIRPYGESVGSKIGIMKAYVRNNS